MLNGTLASGLCLHSLKHCCATLRSFHMDNVHRTAISMDLDSNHWHTRVFVKYLIVSNLRLTKFKHHVFFFLCQVKQLVIQGRIQGGFVGFGQTPLQLQTVQLWYSTVATELPTLQGGRVHYCSCRTTYTIIGYSTAAIELPALQSTCIIPCAIATAQALFNNPPRMGVCLGGDSIQNIHATLLREICSCFMVSMKRCSKQASLTCWIKKKPSQEDSKFITIAYGY